MKEIKIEELLNYIHPLKGENSNISIALASSSKGSNGYSAKVIKSASISSPFSIAYLIKPIVSTLFSLFSLLL